MIFVHELFFSSVDGRRRERESRLFSTDPECVTAAYCRDWRRGPSVVYQGRRLKTRLAKNAARDGDDGAERERAPGGGARRPAPMTDTSKLKKHISVVCERLARGGTLA